MDAEARARLDRLAFYMLKKVNAAIRDYGMIDDGDRVAVAISGGKDSFTLLDILERRIVGAKERYSLAAVHVIGDSRGTDLPSHPELREWLEARGIEYLIRPTYLAEDEAIPMGCQRCSWNRRRTLFEMTKALGCNKLALGHHLDDLAQTALLNLTHRGANETMAPLRSYFGGEITVIRPLAYVPEREIERFARLLDVPPPPSPCPRGEHSQRLWAKRLIAEMTKECRDTCWNLANSALKQMKQTDER